MTRKLDQAEINAALGESTADGMARLRAGWEARLRSDPGDVGALYCLGVVTFRQKDWPLAVGCLEKILPLMPNDMLVSSQFLEMLAYGHFKLQNFQRAISHATRLLDLKPDSPPAYQVLCHAYAYLGDRVRVRHYLEVGMEKSSHAFQYQPALPHTVLPDPGPRLADIRARAWNREALAAAYVAPSVVTWTPSTVGETDAVLLGAAVNLPGDAKLVFEVVDVAARRAVHKTVPAIAAGGSRKRKVKNDRAPAFWQARVDGLKPGTEYRVCLRRAKGKAAGGPVPFVTRCLTPAVVGLRAATPVANTGLTLNGTVGGSNLPGRYRFRYGAAPESLDSETPESGLPGPRTKRFRDVVSHVFRQVNAFALNARFTDYAPPAEADVPPDLAVKLLGPFGKDRNHLDGIGVADAVMGWWNISNLRDEDTSGRPANTIDLRDAEFELVARPDGLDQKDFLFTANCQSYLATQAVDYMKDSAPWALTGQPTDLAGLDNGKWHTLTYTFVNDTNEWSFCGSNAEETPDIAGRYTYAPLERVLARNRGNVFLWFVFGDERRTPQGNLDVYSVGLRFRDESLLAPAAGAVLVRWPTGSIVDPARLTAGWIGNENEFWLSGPDPTSPQVFVWDFGKEVRIEAIRLHQNIVKPAKIAEIEVSRDGKTFKRAWLTHLANTPAENQRFRQAEHKFPKPLVARFLKLAIIDGYQDDFWGLDAIEAFGSGIEPAPETDPCSVSAEIGGLEPGATVYYQLVADNAAGRTASEVRSFTLPADLKPLLRWAKVLRRDGGKITILARLTAMGSPTTLAATLEDDDGNTVAGPAVPAGKESTPRHVTYVVHRPDSAGLRRVVLTAINGAGASPPLAVDLDGGD